MELDKPSYLKEVGIPMVNYIQEVAERMIIMSKIDQRGRLEKEPFTYLQTKNGSILISYQGKQVVMLKGKDAEQLSAKLSVAKADTRQLQILLAKATGNFKRGNEKNGKRNRN